MNYSQLKTLFIRRFHVLKDKSFKRVLRSFSAGEKIVFYFAVLIFIISSLGLLWKVNSSFLVEVPAEGGTLTEGVLGNPRFINPVLAISEADKNLTSLVYSGLTQSSLNDEIDNDLAEEVTISEDGLEYVVRIRTDATFHDGSTVTADDVIFTIQKITDPLIKSPKRGNWDGVSIEKIDHFTIKFKLKKAYSPFIENLSTGILPKHIWKNVSDEEFAFSQFNTIPVGSGPYKIADVEVNSGGIPNYYKLEPFNAPSLKTPYISNLIFKFYPSEDALLKAYNSGDIDMMAGITPQNTTALNAPKSNIVSSPLPRVFAVFFNQNQSKVLLNKEVRQALNLSVPRERIINEVLYGHAVAIEGPLPANIYDWTDDIDSRKYEDRLEEAKSVLASAGWTANPETGVLEKKSDSNTMKLSFSISTSDAPELRAVAEKLISSWQELGAEVSLQMYEIGDLNQNVIRPRKFDTLLFGEVVGRDVDLYPFWHSSQRNDPGLNIALYTNARADSLLEEARSLTDKEEIEESYKAFSNEIKADIPAVFLYSPSFVYVTPSSVKNIKLGHLSTPQDRFRDIRDWYIETDKIWEIFTKY